MKGYNEGSLNVVTILHTDRPSPLNLYLTKVPLHSYGFVRIVALGVFLIDIHGRDRFVLKGKDRFIVTEVILFLQ